MPLIQQMTQQTRYHIHPVDLPADHVKHEKPSRVPTFSVDILGVSILCAIFAGMLFGALFDSVRIGIGSGGGFGLLIAIWRVWFMLSDPWYETKETTFQRVTLDTAEPTNRTIPYNRANGERTHVQTRNNKTLRYDGREYVFEGWQLDRMLDWLNKGYDSIRRESSALGPGLQEIGIGGSNFTIAKQLMQQFGLVGDDNKWTEAGREWLRTI